MKIINPVIKVKKIAADQSVRLVEKTIAKTIEAGNFPDKYCRCLLVCNKSYKRNIFAQF